jgi:hypothetical protein
VNFPDALEAEYHDIAKTSFWKNYMVRLLKLRDQEVRDLCNSAKGEDVPKKQGRIFAYNLVIGMPDKMIEDSKGQTLEAPEVSNK